MRKYSKSAVLDKLFGFESLFKFYKIYKKFKNVFLHSFFLQYLVSIKLLFIEIELLYITAGSVEELVVHRA